MALAHSLKVVRSEVLILVWPLLLPGLTLSIFVAENLHIMDLTRWNEDADKTNEGITGPAAHRGSSLHLPPWRLGSGDPRGGQGFGSARPSSPSTAAQTWCVAGSVGETWVIVG